MVIRTLYLTLEMHEDKKIYKRIYLDDARVEDIERFLIPGFAYQIKMNHLFGNVSTFVSDRVFPQDITTDTLPELKNFPRRTIDIDYEYPWVLLKVYPQEKTRFNGANFIFMNLNGEMFRFMAAWLTAQYRVPAFLKDAYIERL